MKGRGLFIKEKDIRKAKVRGFSGGFIGKEKEE